MRFCLLRRSGTEFRFMDWKRWPADGRRPIVGDALSGERQRNFEVAAEGVISGLIFVVRTMGSRLPQFVREIGGFVGGIVRKRLKHPTISGERRI